MSQGNWIVKSCGKKVEEGKPRIKISVPRFDNSELIARYSRTLIGRCMNPMKQDMKTLLFLLPRIWNVEGHVVGVDLGLGRFQFNFELEEYITEVLKMEPFHFDYWMVSLVRWRPVLESNYPSKITFWVHILDVPLQFCAAPIFQGVGEALGQVQGPVDLIGGRVRVEIDGFKPLIFSVTIEIEEGVEIVATLRYEKLFGYCTECFHLTHDKSHCPSLGTEETVSAKDRTLGNEGTNNTSYKAVVENGARQNDMRRGGQQNRYHEARGDKGKAIVKESQGSGRMEGPFHPYRERSSRGYNDGNFRQRRQADYGERNLRAQPRRGDDPEIKNSGKLMSDAFKGVAGSHGREVTQGSIGDGSETSSKARKSLLFDDPIMVNPEGNLENATLVPVKPVEENVKGYAGETPLDDANLMLEGVLLSDSELLVKDGEELEGWEQGELEDLMEEGELELKDQGMEILNTVEVAQLQGDEEDKDVFGNQEEEEKEDGEENKKATKKDAKSGAGVTGHSKKRGAQIFISPRKKLLTKAVARLGEKGTKKGPSKPKTQAE